MFALSFPKISSIGFAISGEAEQYCWMFVIAFLFVRMLCDCFKSQRRLDAEVLVLRHLRRARLYRRQSVAFSRNTSLAMRCASFDAGMPQYRVSSRRISWICSALQPFFTAPLRCTRNSLACPGRRHHGHHGERFRRRRQRRPAPDIPVGVGVDDVLQWFAELAERVHALFYGLAAKHVDAQLEAALVKLFLVHCSLPFDNALARSRPAQLAIAAECRRLHEPRSIVCIRSP